MLFCKPPGLFNNNNKQIKKNIKNQYKITLEYIATVKANQNPILNNICFQSGQSKNITVYLWDSIML